MERSSKMAKTPRGMGEENRGTMEPDWQHLDDHVCLSALFVILIMVTVAYLLFDRIFDPLCKLLYRFSSCDHIFLSQGPENDDELWRQ
jgi:hypothetical protein